MKTNSTIIAITLFLLFTIGHSLNIDAQAGWQWGKRGGGIGTGSGSLADERVIDVATDTKGNVYVLAVNNPGGTAQVDGHPGIGSYDRLTLASWNCSGRFRWMKNMGIAGVFLGNGLDIDTLGGVYMSGMIGGGDNSLQYTYFDTDTTLPSTQKKIFIVKYDTSGTFQWLRMPQADTVTAAANIFTSAYEAEVASNGDLYLFTHLTPGSYANGAYQVAAYGFHVLKYNKNGLFISGRPIQITVSSDTYGPMLVNMEQAKFARNHKNGRFYIYGDCTPYYGTLKFGTTLVNTAPAAPGIAPIYIAAFDSSGNNLWVKQSSPGAATTGRYCNPVIDENGNVYLGGDANIINGNSFNGHSFSNTLSTLMPVPFVIAIDSNGNNRWVTTGNDNSLSTGSSIAYRNGKVYLCGAYTDRMEWGNFVVDKPGAASGDYVPYVASFNAQNGKILSLDTLLATPGLNDITAATTDKNGNMYAGGLFNYNLYVSRDTLTNVGGSYDWFVAKYGTALCNCTVPAPGYNYSASSNTVTFTYTGNSYTSISWDFGDGSAPVSTPNPTHTYSSPGTYTACVSVANSCGSNIHCKTIKTTTTNGISNILSNGDLQIMPNPAYDKLRIGTAAPGTILKLYNTTGSVVKQIALTAYDEEVDISGLPPGCYLLHCTDKTGKCYTGKIVKL